MGCVFMECRRFFLWLMIGMWSGFCYGQQSDKLAVQQQYELIAQCYQDIDSLNAYISKARLQLDSLRTSWRQTCEAYLNSSQSQTAEELDYLIAHTDPAFDGEDLYNRLVGARQLAETDDAEKEPEGVTEPEEPVDGDETLVVSEDADKPESPMKSERKKVVDESTGEIMKNRKEPEFTKKESNGAKSGNNRMN